MSSSSLDTSFHSDASSVLDPALNPHGNPWAFIPAENPCEWDAFFDERTADLYCPSSNSPNVLCVRVLVSHNQQDLSTDGSREPAHDEAYELERFLFVPREWEDEQDCLRTDLRVYRNGQYTLRKDNEETRACYMPWSGPDGKTYTPLSITYYP